MEEAPEPVPWFEATLSAETSGTDAPVWVTGGGANAPSSSIQGAPVASPRAAPIERFGRAIPVGENPRFKGNVGGEKPGTFDASMPPSPVTRLDGKPIINTDDAPAMTGAVERFLVWLGTMWCSGGKPAA